MSIPASIKRKESNGRNDFSPVGVVKADASHAKNIARKTRSERVDEKHRGWAKRRQGRPVTGVHKSITPR